MQQTTLGPRTNISTTLPTTPVWDGSRPLQGRRRIITVRRGHRGVGLAFGILVAFCGTPAVADEGREKRLEDKVEYLEGRVRELERRLDALAAGEEHSDRQTTSNPGSVAGQEQVTPNEAASAPPPPSIGIGTPDEAPQETFVFRENAVTLKPRKVELSTEFGYIHGSGLLQTDRAFTSSTAVRLGVRDWLEAGAVLPIYTANRSQVVGPFRSRSKHVAGVGDVSLQANARLIEQSANFPGIVLSLGTILPTGISPYNFSFYQPNPARPAYNPNPIDFTGSYLSRGAWAAISNLQFYKTLDPVILFLGAGIQQPFAQSVGGHRVGVGLTYVYNAGLSFALSEKSTLGFQINGSYQNKLNVDHQLVPESDLEAVIARISLIQRIYRNTYVEPAITHGLTREAPDLGLDIGLRHRF